MRNELLEQLITLARQRRDHAARQAVRGETTARTAQQALKSLQDYQDSLRQKFVQNVGQLTCVDRIDRQRLFDASLQRALIEQRAQVDRLLNDHRSSVVRARLAQHKLAAFEVLSERQIRLLRAKEQQHEQKQTDESAARVHRQTAGEPRS
jgi:flagellar export protein FliJ